MSGIDEFPNDDPQADQDAARRLLIENSDNEPIVVNSLAEMLEYMKYITQPCEIKFYPNFEANLLELPLKLNRELYVLKSGLKLGKISVRKDKTIKVYIEKRVEVPPTES
jgi:hypothetical protein